MIEPNKGWSGLSARAHVLAGTVQLAQLLVQLQLYHLVACALSCSADVASVVPTVRMIFLKNV